MFIAACAAAVDGNEPVLARPHLLTVLLLVFVWAIATALDWVLFNLPAVEEFRNFLPLLPQKAFLGVPVDRLTRKASCPSFVREDLLRVTSTT